MPRYAVDAPLGFSRIHLRRTRRRMGLTDLVEIHHVVPREFRDHPTVRAHGYDIEGDYNTLFVPSRRGGHLGVRRPVHTGGHMAYNAYVRTGLDAVSSPESFVALLWVLFLASRGRRDVPWRSRGSGPSIRTATPRIGTSGP